MKVFTKRHGKMEYLKKFDRLQRVLNESIGYSLVPRGVYRFKTMEESDNWMTDNITRTRKKIQQGKGHVNPVDKMDVDYLKSALEEKNNKK